jgi:hypothetical protein
MKKNHIVQMLAVGLLWSVTANADIVWSGSMYQRTYHDVSAIDINQDGADDFTFLMEIDTVGGTYYDYFIEPTNGQIVREKISETVTGGGWPLASGSAISASVEVPEPFDAVWDASKASLFSYGFPTDPDWVDYSGNFRHTDGFLGVSFEVDGSTHYGWIEFSHDRTRSEPLNNSLMIHGRAYESTPDKPIVAGVIPEPSTGILTMVGSLSLLLIARSRRHGKPARIPHIPAASPPPEEW